MTDEEHGTWVEYQKFVLAELKRLNANQEVMNVAIGLLKVDNAILNVKAGVWGLGGSLLGLVIMFATKKLFG